uniref:DUF1007 family protein n=1 Tax=Pantoea sp. IMH TaxID=1267600 RepID=UPI00046A7A99|nr:DUF1007 family protein [Pantoea sp. IMH]
MLHYNVSVKVALLLVVLFTSFAWAHPHSFIDMQATLVHKDDRITGLKMHWVMDEITSADLLYDAGESKPDSETWKKLAAEVMANVLGQHYFSEFWHEGKKVKFGNLPPFYQLSRQGHRAVLDFILPLGEPQPLTGQRYVFSTFDPTYFVDMSYVSEKSLHIPAELADRCAFTLKTPTPDASLQAYALSLDKADSPAEDLALGQQFAQTVTLQCQ